MNETYRGKLYPPLLDIYIFIKNILNFMFETRRNNNNTNKKYRNPSLHTPIYKLISAPRVAMIITFIVYSRILYINKKASKTIASTTTKLATITTTQKKKHTQQQNKNSRYNICMRFIFIYL